MFNIREEKQNPIM